MNNSNNFGDIPNVPKELKKDIEIETKILDVSHFKIEDKLSNLGAQMIFEGELLAIWLANIEGKKVRVRKSKDNVAVEYKQSIGNIDGVKKMEEIGYNTDDFDNTIKVFQKLGFNEISRSIKTRVSYLLENHKIFGKVQFDFDKYSSLNGRSDIPEFMEIEASSKEIILKVVKLLGYKKKDCKNYGPKELLEYYS